MAIMYPKGGPVENDSYIAEPTVYYALAKQLSEEFVVIHSIPWLAQVAMEVDNRPVPTGEVDFLILHQTLGILALEVKGGRIRLENNKAILPNGDSFEPIRQVRRGTHALGKWIFKTSNISYRIGYGIVFPQSRVKGRLLPPAFIDRTGNKPQSICIDQGDLFSIEAQIKDLMQYWQEALRNKTLSQYEIDDIVKNLLPDPDFTPTWIERYDILRKKYLQLTTQQLVRLRQMANASRFVLTGRSGTGKTVLAVEYALARVKEGKKILFLAYNVALTKAIKKELGNYQNSRIHIFNYHDLCRYAARKLNREQEASKSKIWFEQLAHIALHDAIRQELMEDYDVLIIDEGQVFNENWLIDLATWFSQKSILVCCDETQSFAYEHKTSAEKIARIIGSPAPFTLTLNMRSPKPVFNRLQQVIVSMYEQSSQREDENYALQEIICTNPTEYLHYVIEKLRTNNVPPENIMVVYWNRSPTYKEGAEQFVGQTISVYKCRGIESPVVIVWYDPYDSIDDVTWSCAYSRATSSCIAIYHWNTLLKYCNEKFAQILIDDASRQSDWLSPVQQKLYHHQKLQREMYEKQTQWPPLSWQLSILPNQVYRWFAFWNSWYISRQKTQIETLLAAMHIAVLSSYVVYAEGRFYGGTYTSGYRYVREFSYSAHVSSLVQSDIPISWCDACQNWTRGCIDDNSDIHYWHCVDCQVSSTSTGKELGVNHIGWIPQINTQHDTIFSLAQFYLNELKFAQKRFIEKYCTNVHDPLTWAARIITGTEILALSPGTLIETEAIYLLSWNSCPWLATQIAEVQWREALASSMRTWARCKAVRRRAKGVYEVIDCLFNFQMDSQDAEN